MKDWRAIVSQGLLSWLMARGVMQSIMEMTGASAAVLLSWAAWGVGCLVLAWAVGMCRGRMWRALLTGAVCIVSVVWAGGAWASLFDAVVHVYEVYYGTALLKIGGSADPMLAVFAVGVLCACRVIQGINEKRMLFIWTVPALVLLIVLIGGKMPSIPAVGAIVISLLGSRLLCRMERQNDCFLKENYGFFLGFMAFLAVGMWVGTLLQEPIYREVKEKRALFEEKIGNMDELRWDKLLEALKDKTYWQDRWNELALDKAITGMSYGRIPNVDELVPGNDVVFQLNWLGGLQDGQLQETEGSLKGVHYVKVFTACTYKDNNWYEERNIMLSNERMDAMLSGAQTQFGVAGRNDFLDNPLPLLMEQDPRFSGWGLVQIEEMQPMRRLYPLVPGIAVSAGQDTWHMWSYARETQLKKDWREILSSIMADFGTLSFMQDYNEYARAAYLSVPEEIQEALEPLIEEYGQSASEFTGDPEAYAAARTLVCNILSANASYTYSPGRVPEGEDLIIWFLLENGKGYCTHFASAGVMLFRMLGVPARFCEGYRLVGREEICLEALESNAHAWVEIYVDNLGWLPVEVTPLQNDDGLIGTEDTTSADQETEGATDTKPEETPSIEADASDHTEEVGGKDVAGAQFKLFSGILIFVNLAGGAAAGLTLLVRKQRQSWYQRLERSKKMRPKQAIEIYSNECRTLQKYFGELKTEIWSEAERVRFSEYDREAAYSNHLMNAEMAAFQEACFYRKREAYDAEISGWRRILFWVWYPDV